MEKVYMKNTLAKEKPIETINGWIMLGVCLALLIGTIALWAWLIRESVALPEGAIINLWLLAGCLGASLFTLTMLCGFFTLQPNEGRALLLFGSYVGTERRSGFHWTNPFMTKTRISMRARNFNTPKLKVNDKRGNPIEIGAVVVWRVADSAQALFDVDDYQEFVSVQSESALRYLANHYAYDDGEEGEVTLRSAQDEVAHFLQAELQNRLVTAGVIVEEAKLAHLAYAQEIAQAMLRRQQAEAIIAARQKIVHGAVSMVEMALSELSQRDIVKLDDERKATMVSNLLVVLCSESEAQPVINAGSLYS